MSATYVGDAFQAELDRVGVSYETAGAAEYVHAAKLGEEIWLLGPPHLCPRPSWQGSTSDALALVLTVADAAGPEGFWVAFGDSD